MAKVSSELEEQVIKKVAQEMTASGLQYSNAEVIHVTTPERALLAAILDRAVRDLTLNDHTIVRDAIVWFLHSQYSDRCFNFQDCVEALDIDSSRVNFILNSAREAETWLYGQCQTKRKKSGIRDCPLARTIWTGGKKNTAVQRS